MLYDFLGDVHCSENKKQICFYHFSSTSTINTKGKYAVHISADASEKSKFLYIPYGKTFAN